MDEPLNIESAEPEPTSSPKAANPWIITSVIISTACCFCFASPGVHHAYIDPILNEIGLTAGL
jgi:hypothetical protein